LTTVNYLKDAQRRAVTQRQMWHLYARHGLTGADCSTWTTSARYSKSFADVF